MYLIVLNIGLEMSAVISTIHWSTLQAT